MNILKDFDEAIAEQEARKNSVGRGYIIGNKKPYDAYMDNNSWDKFIQQMRPEHYNQYSAGSGKELEPKDGKPPKMASFASSSQMICRLSGDIEGFIFEEQLPTTIGGLANLDGYMEFPDKYIFVEAKCHEPYGHSSKQSISTNYKALYEELRKHPETKFNCEITYVDEKTKKMQVEFLCAGKTVQYFDIKQMICHMLGIATKFLKYPCDKQTLFLYLLYNPSNLQMSQDAKDEILRIYDDTCWAANNYDFKAMFGCIIDFLIEQKGFRANLDYVSWLKNSFNFTLCDQTDYKNLLK